MNKEKKPRAFYKGITFMMSTKTNKLLSIQ